MCAKVTLFYQNSTETFGVDLNFSLSPPQTPLHFFCFTATFSLPKGSITFLFLDARCDSISLWVNKEYLYICVPRSHALSSSSSQFSSKQLIRKGAIRLSGDVSTTGGRGGEKGRFRFRIFCPLLLRSLVISPKYKPQLSAQGYALIACSCVLSLSPRNISLSCPPKDTLS